MAAPERQWPMDQKLLKLYNNLFVTGEMVARMTTNRYRIVFLSTKRMYVNSELRLPVLTRNSKDDPILLPSSLYFPHVAYFITKLLYTIIRRQQP